MHRTMPLFMSLIISYVLMAAGYTANNSPHSIQFVSTQPSRSTASFVSATRKGGIGKNESPSTNPMSVILSPSSMPTMQPATAAFTSTQSASPSVEKILVIIPVVDDNEQPSKSNTPKPEARPNVAASPSTEDITQTPSINKSNSLTITEPKPTNEASLPTADTKHKDLQDSDTDVQSLEFYRNQLFSPICSIFFRGKSILDNQAVAAFEATAKRFVTDNLGELDLPVAIANVKDVTVVSQVMSWKRPSRILQADSAATGLDVYFQIDIIATGYATKTELEHSFQELFDSNNNIFRDSISLTTEGSRLNPTQLTLAVVAGCSGLMSLMLIISIFMWKKKGGGTQTASPKPIKKAKCSPKAQYPVQKSHLSRGGGVYALNSASSSSSGSSSQSSASDEMDNASFDNSFCASLRFCPSVERRDEEVNELFACNQSSINDEETDEEAFNAEWMKGNKTASTIMLSSDDLSGFDEDLRRAEC